MHRLLASIRAYTTCRAFGLGRVAAAYRAGRFLLTGRTGRYAIKWRPQGHQVEQRSAGTCTRKTGPNGEPCGLKPPCPDCGLACHDVPEGA